MKCRRWRSRNGTMVRSHNRADRADWRQALARSRTGSPDWPSSAGSDAHTLRRVGPTWTEAPGRNREEFLASLKSGRGRPGGRDGERAAVSGDAYGVIRRYVASLVGFEPRDHGGWRRAACLAFALGVAALSVPAAGDCRGRQGCASRATSRRRPRDGRPSPVRFVDGRGR